MADSTFIVEHTRTKNQETVTEVQFEAMKKTFPGMFRRVDAPKADISKYSEKAKDIIKEGDKKARSEDK